MHSGLLFRATIAICLGFTLKSLANDTDSPSLCKIRVIEKKSGWPVPLVELKTTHQVRFVTDNAGLIAFDLPECLGHETWFDVLGHGYEVPADGFGQRGVRLTPERGKTLTVQVDRTSIARRLGRLTGTGLFAESQKLGLERDWKDAPLVGSDSVLNAVHQGKLFWAWGDTTLANYPLGIFDTTSATTSTNPFPSPQPPLKPRFDYFQSPDGRPRGVAKMPGTGPTWLGGYVSLPDKNGQSKLVATYTKIKPPLDAYEIGLCVWNEARAEFQPLRTIWQKSAKDPKPPVVPDGHSAFWKDDRGKEFVLFGNPLPKVRCPSTFEAWQDPTQWELLQPQPDLPAVNDAGPVVPHTGSIAWNDYRKRWVTVFMQSFGRPSAFGELWYAESRSPFGPWGPAIKVLSHTNYTFYNPRLHPDFSEPGSPVLLFEGTYTQQFADRPAATPRYDYNQILYRLDLDDLALAAAQKSSEAP